MSPAPLGALWYRIRALVARHGARVLWYAPFLVAAAAQGAGAVFRMLEGQWAYGFTCALFGTMLALWPIAARYQFREAWASGYVEGVFTLGDAYRGTMPAPLLRHAITGYLAPEPWDKAPQPRTTGDEGE